MKRLIELAVLALCALNACKPSSLALDMLRSEQVRCPEPAMLDFMGGKLKWNYTTGLELKAFMDVYEACGDESILAYVDSWYDAIIDSTGRIATYKESNYNVDHICPARTLFALYDKTAKPKYLKAMQIVRAQIDRQPRTSEGGFWHKQIYPHQMWLDGLYMAQPFYAEFTSRFADPAQKDSLYKDIINHFLVASRHTYDPQTELYRHAWDESKQMFWCDSDTGQSAHAWGRALGWYLMAIVETLDYIPAHIVEREELIKLLQSIVAVLPRYADSQSGMWYQVLDSPGREGNYLESTASAMFIFAILKGVRMGYLDADLKPWSQNLYRSFVQQFVRNDPDGTVSVTDCCAVAGLGGKTMRSGTFDYYISEPVRDNDPKAIGPFIWATLEYEKTL